MDCPGCLVPLSPPRPSERYLRGRLVGGRYLIQGLLGEGAMGCVYRARHVQLDRTCALKVIRTPGLGGRGSFRDTDEGLDTLTLPSSPSHDPAIPPCEEAVKRFRIEARAVARLDHPNIVRLLDFGCDPEDNLWYLVTEQLEGKDLLDVLNVEVVLPTDRIVRIMRQVCSALEHAHEAGVIHRDMKPDNIRIVPRRAEDGTPTEHVKLIDFGTALLLPNRRRDSAAAPPSVAPDSASATPIDAFDRPLIGTPAYMSPEQASGTGADARSDIYSCGVVLFEMATGRLPFEHSTPIALAAAHVEADPPAPRSVNPNVDPALEAIILSCLSKDPSARPQSARDLSRTLSDLGTTSRPCAPSILGAA